MPSTPSPTPRLRIALALVPALVLTACTGGSYRSAYDGPVPYDGYDPAAASSGGSFTPSHYYPPPGPPSDPWGPYIREAAARFQVPDQWVRAVMHQESGGREQAISPVGAMGLMQVMPATYNGLRQRHGLGRDPYDPHNNILAGTAYIREMYDRFGAPGFLAAYNAGPDRLSAYLAGSTALPDETVNYLAAITPNLGNALPLSGPLAMYASNNGGTYAAAPTVASLASGCDANAAYDPSHPCTPLEQQATTPTPPVQLASAGGCDPDAAFDPGRPCQPAATPMATQSFAPVSAIYQPQPPPTRYQPPPAQRAFAPPPVGPTASGGWEIQVGAFANPGLARAVAEGARAEAPAQLRSATVILPTTSPFGGNVLYRARLANLSATSASQACAQLNQRQLPCVVVQPNGS
jgi:hypothetical protein